MIIVHDKIAIMNATLMYGEREKGWYTCNHHIYDTRKHKTTINDMISTEITKLCPL